MTFDRRTAETELNLRQSLILLGILISLLLAINFVFSPKNTNFTFADTLDLSGYAWSDTIGWVSLSGPGYGFSIDVDSKLSGYAWSDNIGWITSNESELSGCPSTPCSAIIQGGQLNGWLRALSNGDGWDGWVSLSGPGYGVTQDAGSGALSGYAWGSDVIGWLDFSGTSAPLGCTPVYSCSGTQIIQYTNSLCQTSTFATCELPTFCSDGVSTCLYPQPSFVPSEGLTGHLQPLPSLVSSGAVIQIHWNVDNVESCTVTGTNGDGTGSNGTGTWNTSSGNQTSSPIVSRTTYTLTCTAYPGVTPATQTESETVNIVPIFEEQ